MKKSGTKLSASRLPVFRPDGPALVIAPAARDLQIPRRVTLEFESQATHERDRRRIVWLNVRLETMQSIVTKTELNHGRDSGAHVAAPLMRLQRVVAQVRGLERAQYDLGDVDDAREIAVGGSHEAADS